MRDTLPPTSYVSRVIPVAPAVARQVFDACRVDRQHRATDAHRWCVSAGSRFHLELEGPGHGASYGMRAVPGRLRLGLVGAAPVELELVAWSRDRTEVGLRLARRRRPGERYLDGANAVVDALAGELEVRGLLALHPSHVAGQEAAASAWL